MSIVAWTLARFVALTLLFAGVVSLSNWPLHRSLPENTGVLTVSFSHGADRRARCRQATPEELADLPPNMRRPEICPRERPPIYLELDIDGVRALETEVPPSGFGRDGPSRVHESFTLPVGEHDVAVRMRDHSGDGFEWQAQGTVPVGPADHKVIDFRAAAGGFLFH